MGSGGIATGGEVIQEGTSLFIKETNEVVWITAIRDEQVQVETVSSSVKLDKERVVQRIRDNDFVVESQPVR